jgi:biopolymer transport protein ExbD
MLSRRRSALSVYESHHGPNMTPMVDVVMVILIFFMASAAMLGPEWFLASSIAKPNTVSKPADPANTRRFEVGVLPSPDGGAVIALADAQLSITDFETRVIQAVTEVGAEQVTVVIIPDPKVSYDRVVAVHELCARLGITKLALGER